MLLFCFQLLNIVVSLTAVMSDQIETVRRLIPSVYQLQNKNHVSLNQLKNLLSLKVRRLRYK